jgi:hypothetical protein
LCSQFEQSLANRFDLLRDVWFVAPVIKECGYSGAEGAYVVRISGMWQGGQALRVDVPGGAAPSAISPLGGLGGLAGAGLFPPGWFADVRKVPRAFVDRLNQTLTVRYQVIPYPQQAYSQLYFQSLAPNYPVDFGRARSGNLFVQEDTVVCEPALLPTPFEKLPPLEGLPKAISYRSVQCSPLATPYQNPNHLVDFNSDSWMQFAAPGTKIAQPGAPIAITFGGTGTPGSSPAGHSGAAGPAIPAPTCGNGVCEGGEGSSLCPRDCPISEGLGVVGQCTFQLSQAEELYGLETASWDSGDDISITAIRIGAREIRPAEPIKISPDTTTISYADFGIPTPIRAGTVRVEFKYSGTPALRELNPLPDVALLSMNVTPQQVTTGREVLIQGTVSRREFVTQGGRLLHCFYQWEGGCYPCIGADCKPGKQQFMGKPNWAFLVPLPFDASGISKIVDAVRKPIGALPVPPIRQVFFDVDELLQEGAPSAGGIAGATASATGAATGLLAEVGVASAQVAASPEALATLATDIDRLLGEAAKLSQQARTQRDQANLAGAQQSATDALKKLDEAQTKFNAAATMLSQLQDTLSTLTTNQQLQVSSTSAQIATSRIVASQLRDSISSILTALNPNAQAARDPSGSGLTAARLEIERAKLAAVDGAKNITPAETDKRLLLVPSIKNSVQIGVLVGVNNFLNSETELGVVVTVLSTGVAVPELLVGVVTGLLRELGVITGYTGADIATLEIRQGAACLEKGLLGCAIRGAFSDNRCTPGTSCPPGFTSSGGVCVLKEKNDETGVETITQIVRRWNCPVSYVMATWWDLRSEPEPDPDGPGDYAFTESTCKQATFLEKLLFNTAWWGAFDTLFKAVEDLQTNSVNEQVKAYEKVMAKHQTCEACVVTGVTYDHGLEQGKVNAAVAACEARFPTSAGSIVCLEPKSGATVAVPSNQCGAGQTQIKAKEQCASTIGRINAATVPGVWCAERQDIAVSETQVEQLYSRNAQIVEAGKSRTVAECVRTKEQCEVKGANYKAFDGETTCSGTTSVLDIQTKKKGVALDGLGEDCPACLKAKGTFCAQLTYKAETPRGGRPQAVSGFCTINAACPADRSAENIYYEKITQCNRFAWYKGLVPSAKPPEIAPSPNKCISECIRFRSANADLVWCYDPAKPATANCKFRDECTLDGKAETEDQCTAWLNSSQTVSVAIPHGKARLAVAVNDTKGRPIENEPVNVASAKGYTKADGNVVFENLDAPSEGRQYAVTVRTQSQKIILRSQQSETLTFTVASAEEAPKGESGSVMIAPGAYGRCIVPGTPIASSADAQTGIIQGYSELASTYPTATSFVIGGVSGKLSLDLCGSNILFARSGRYLAFADTCPSSAPTPVGVFAAEGRRFQICVNEAVVGRGTLKVQPTCDGDFVTAATVDGQSICVASSVYAPIPGVAVAPTTPAPGAPTTPSAVPVALNAPTKPVIIGPSYGPDRQIEYRGATVVQERNVITNFIWKFDAEERRISRSSGAGGTIEDIQTKVWNPGKHKVELTVETIAGRSSSFIEFDIYKRIFDDTEFAPTGSWQRDRIATEFEFVEFLRGDVGAAATLNFVGSQITWLGYADAQGAPARIEVLGENGAVVDGVPEIDTSTTNSWTSKTLPFGKYTLRISHTGKFGSQGGTKISIDGAQATVLEGPRATINVVAELPAGFEIPEAPENGASATLPITAQFTALPATGQIGVASAQLGIPQTGYGYTPSPYQVGGTSGQSGWGMANSWLGQTPFSSGIQAIAEANQKLGTGQTFYQRQFIIPPGTDPQCPAVDPAFPRPKALLSGKLAAPTKLDGIPEEPYPYPTSEGAVTPIDTTAFVTIRDATGGIASGCDTTQTGVRREVLAQRLGTSAASLPASLACDRIPIQTTSGGITGAFRYFYTAPRDGPFAVTVSATGSAGTSETVYFPGPGGGSK